MITILQEPNELMDAAYFRREYRVMVQVNLETTLQASVKIETEVNGLVQAENVYASPFAVTSVPGTSTTWTFKIYPWQLAWKYLSKFREERLFLDNAGEIFKTDVTFQRLIRFKFTEVVPDAAGVFTAGSSAFTQYVSLLDASPDPKTMKDLRSRNTMWGYPMKWLTSKPSGSLVGPGTRETLAVWSDQVNGIEVTSYDEAGAVLETGTAYIKTGPSNSQIVSVVAIGPAQINELDPGVWSTGSVTIGPDVDYYEVRAGWLCGDGTLIPFVEDRRLYYSECAEFALELWFLNEFGQWDYLPVQSLISEEATTTEQAGFFASESPGGVYDSRAVFRYTESGAELLMQQVPVRERDWILRAAKRSLLAFATGGKGMIPGERFPVEIEAGRAQTSSRNGLPEVELKIRYLHTHTSQQG